MAMCTGTLGAQTCQITSPLPLPTSSTSTYIVNVTTVVFNGAQSVLGSTVTIMALNNNTTPIPISGSLSTTSGAMSIVAVNASTQSVGYQAGTSSVPVNVLNNINVNEIYQPTVLGATVTYNGTQTVLANQGAVGTGDWRVTMSTNNVTLNQPTVLGATVTFNGTQNVNSAINILGNPAAQKVDFSSTTYVQVSSISVVIATVTVQAPNNNTTALPVSGTFFQANQPVSVSTGGITAIIYEPAVLGATITYNGTQTVSANQGTAGAGWRVDLTTGVQVNGTVTANQGTQGTSAWKVDFSTGVQINLARNFAVDYTTGVRVNTTGGSNLGVDLSTGVQVNYARNPAIDLSTGARVNTTGGSNLGVDFSTGVTVTPPTLTKGTQGSTGFSDQELKDAGRTAVTYYVTASTVGATTVESALTFTKSAGTAANTSGLFFVITNGKTFRINSITVATLGNAVATAETTTISLRVATAGNCNTATTPVLFKFRSATPATASAWDRLPTFEIPDGYEIAGNGTINFCASVNSTFVTNAPTVDMLIEGYEY